MPRSEKLKARQVGALAANAVSENKARNTTLKILKGDLWK